MTRRVNERIEDPPARRAGWSHDWQSRWSHEVGRKPLRPVPCSWQATRQIRMAAAHAVCGRSAWPQRTLSAACPDGRPGQRNAIGGTCGLGPSRMAPSCHRSKQPPTPASKVAYPPLVNPLRLLPALALSTFALVAVSACGEQTRASNPATATDTASASSDEAQIRAVVADWVSAIEDQDYAKACARQTKQNTKAMLEEMA